MKRAALLLAVVAALLLGAPSAVLGAPPNRLEVATAEPTAGTSLTAFHFSVRYVSGAGNPASGVTVRIGPLDVPLHLASGTATDGTWSGSSLLPVGTWSLTYRATASKGPSPSLTGPTVTVTDASPSPETRPGDEEPAPSSSGGADVGGPSSGPAQSPAAEPKAPVKPGRDSRTPEPAPGDGSGSRDGVPRTEDTPEPAAGSGDRASDGGRRRGGAAPVPRGPDIPAAEDGTPLEDEGSPWGRRDLLLLLAAIVSVATVALLGTGWLLASREREDEAAGDDATAGAAATAARVARRRRAQASAGVLPDHDPVLMALGLDQPGDAPQDPLRGAARGAAPRPRKAPRAQR